MLRSRLSCIATALPRLSSRYEPLRLHARLLGSPHVPASCLHTISGARNAVHAAATFQRVIAHGSPLERPASHVPVPVPVPSSRSYASKPHRTKKGKRDKDSVGYNTLNSDQHPPRN